MFETLGSLLGCCGVPGLIISSLEVFDFSLFWRNHLPTIFMQSVQVFVVLKRL